MTEGLRGTVVERLDGFVAERANIGRKDAKIAIRRGRVCVNGVVEVSPERKIDDQQVSFDGRILPQSPFVYILMNKPAGVLSASEDKHKETVVDLVPDELKRKELFPVGRLDKDTTGLLIITNDGPAAHRLLAPASHVDKEYEAVLDGIPDQSVKDRFEKGIDLGDFKSMPAKLEITGTDTVRVTIHEGKFHQVKRMFAACGFEVLKLCRIRFGGVLLPDDLAPGECRYLNEDEMKSLGI